MKKIILASMMLTTSITLQASSLPYDAVSKGSLANLTLINYAKNSVGAKLATLGCEVKKRDINFEPYVLLMPEGNIGARMWVELWEINACKNTYLTTIGFKEVKDGAIHRVVDMEKINKQKNIKNDDFASRVVDFLQSQYEGAQKIPKQELLKEIQKQILKAQSYNLTTEQNIVGYINTAWLLGLDFDTSFPAAKDILTNSKFNEEEKIESLKNLTVKMFEALEEK